MPGEVRPDGPAWRFVVAIYSQPKVAEACLRLQDSIGIDVVLLLAAGYAARMGISLDQAALDALESRVAGWRAGVVRPLRTVRRFLKGFELPGLSAEAEALRRAVQAAELSAEQLQLATLVQELPLLAAGPNGGVPVLPQLHAILRRAAASHGAELDEALEGQIAVVASAVERTRI